ncbi:MAG: ABC transporter permease subunit [Oscillospiraceae bacterium]|nr:ABC transporter permease subunit [Candidatus Equicaccousia limihippi]
MKAIFKREFKAYFTSPLGFVILAIMFFFLGYIFSSIFSSDYNNISYCFVYINTYSMLIVPLITMRLFSEERKQKTDQLLFTSPVKLWKIVGGKYLAAFSLFALCYSISLIFQFILMAFSTINWMLYLSSLLGTFLMGGAILAIGLFISSCTESQIVAAILGIIVSLLIMMIDYFSALFSNDILTAICDYISFNNRFNTFASGIIDFSNAVFFLSVIALFLFLTVRSLERKRWA